jgi:hypothetical protein
MTRVVSTWRFIAAFGVLLVAGAAWSAESASASLQRDTARCQAGSIDACYDAIRWSPRDPALLIGLGDALARSGRPVDAIRNYRRAATIAPSFPGLSAKINSVEARMNAKRAPRSLASAASSKTVAKLYSNSAAESESH